LFSALLGGKQGVLVKLPIRVALITSMLMSLLVSGKCFAQTVEQVSGTQAVLSMQGSESVSVGDKINFLSKNLDVVGRGEVKKVSEGGKKALATIQSGKVIRGMSVERSQADKVGTPTTPTNSQVTAQGSAQASSDAPSEKPFRQLTDEERRILSIGYIDTPQYIIGGILGMYPGFGIGHAVQGRYMDKGWIFTVGELGSVAGLGVGLGNCLGTHYDEPCDNALITVSVISFIGFKIWECIDVWVGPNQINSEIIEIRRSLSTDLERSQKSRVTLNGGLIPTKDGVRAGLLMTF
jgi:hypothetical protein